MEQERSDVLGGGAVTRVRFEGYDNVDATVVTPDGVEHAVRLGCDFYADVDGFEVGPDDPDYNRFMFWLRRSDECQAAGELCDQLMAEHPDILPTPRVPRMELARWEPVSDDRSEDVPVYEMSAKWGPHVEPFGSWALLVWDVLCDLWNRRTAPLWPEWYPGDVLPVGDPGPPDIFMTSYSPDGPPVTGTIEQMAPLLRAALRPEEWDEGLSEL